MHKPLCLKSLPVLFVAAALAGCSDTGAASPHAAETHDSDHSETQDHGAAHEGDAHADGDPHDGDHGDGDHGHDDGDEPRRESGAHLHGDAELSVALEAGSLFVQLDTPLFNLTGFEHAAATDEEKRIVRDVEARLARPAELFSMTASAGCVPANEGNALPALLADTHDEHDEHDEHAEDEHGSHRDVLLEYSFTCASPDKLTEIRVHLFEHFRNFQALDVVYLAQNTQLSTALSPDNATINLAANR